jgi:hypothetical protein
MKEKFKVFLVLLAAALVLMACPNPAGEEEGEGDGSGINWGNESGGTLTIINNTAKDVVIFQGQTPSNSTILGGVRGLASKDFNISDDVDDFEVGGYMILRGVTKEEYDANKTNLSRAKIEYSAMATYGQNKKYRAEISPNYTGDYAFKVTNSGRIGLELRKDSPDGEKITYLPALGTNVLIYTDTSDSISIFPVYVYYSRSKQTVTTLKPTDHFASVGASPRPATDANIQSYTFPVDQSVTWDQLKSQLESPMAYFTVTNSVPNQSTRFTLSGTNFFRSQNGYDSIGSGEQLTFELESTKDGTQKDIQLTLYNQSLKIPVRKSGEVGQPVIRNGYDYTITLQFAGGSVSDAGNYTAVITESTEKRDLSDEIVSL